MRKTKKKSSGWRPLDKRGPYQERRARHVAAHVAKLRGDCDELKLWHSCPVRQCRRVRGCTGEPSRCLNERRPAPAQETAKETAKAAKPKYIIGNQTLPPMSSAEAAAAIAASIANHHT